MPSKVYINKVEKFMPNEAVSNDEMEEILGKINDTPSKSRRLILRNNGIQKRYYALDRNGNFKLSNAEIPAEVVKKLVSEVFLLQDMEVLSCGTSTPDFLLPSPAAMVHGLLKINRWN